MTTREITHRAAVRRRMAGVIGAAVAATALIVSGLAAPATAADEELIVNGGFEAGLDGWFVNNGNGSDGGTLSIVSDAYAGASADLFLAADEAIFADFGSIQSGIREEQSQ